MVCEPSILDIFEFLAGYVQQYEMTGHNFPNVVPNSK
jgi:hypothetical protein